MLWQPKAVPGLMLQTGLMYADTQYGNSIPGCDFVGPGALTPQCPAIGALYKLPGAQMSFAPKLSGSASLTYEWDIGSSLEGRFNIGSKYMASYNTGSDLDVEKQQGAYTAVSYTHLDVYKRQLQNIDYTLGEPPCSARNRNAIHSASPFWWD